MAAVVLVCLIGLLLVYWIVYRPVEIRARCTHEEIVNARKRPYNDPMKRRTRTYHECLRDYGIKE